ncbi:MAG: S-layer homology domain-containing protein [Acidimicrobiia bacterium]|nr:S-layer homology domain-containing protein [Acidimicrobiia bacterium]
MFLYSRRTVAVIAVFVLVAGLVFAAPVSAVDDPPSPSYLPAFDACEDIPPSDFGDLPSDHSQVDNINCIAYYEITKGTSDTTYSPHDPVTREQMALFLIRLAGRVGIAVPSASDFGFSDIGHLSAESQVAINQLARLEITKGTSATTYSPEDPVSRWQMALFIARLMDKMEPPSYGNYTFGYTPADVVDTADRPVDEPFDDLDEVRQDTVDKINQLYELGIIDDITEGTYRPSVDITRATMADFMAGVLDHSGLRPPGLSVKAARISEYGPTEVVLMVSLRDPEVGPVASRRVDIFSSHAVGGGLDEEGACIPAFVTGDCTWNADDKVTDQEGNIWVTYQLDDGVTSVYYAWIGSSLGAQFDADEVDEATVAVTSQPNVAGIRVTSDIREQADGNKVHIARTRRVTLTVQLVDRDDRPLSRPGFDFEVGLEQVVNGTQRLRHDDVLLTTDEEGKRTFRVDGVEDQRDVPDQTRVDEVTFTHVGEEPGSLDLSDVVVTIEWSEEASETHKAVAKAPDYVIVKEDGDVSIRASISLYDQYGFGYRAAAGQQVGMTIGGEDLTASVNGSGTGSRSARLQHQEAGYSVPVSFTADPGGDGVDLPAGVGDPPGVSVQLVTVATSKDASKDMRIHTFFPRHNRFITEAGDGNPDAELLFYYKPRDTFKAGDRLIMIDEFEELLTPFEDEENPATVDIVTYDREGSSEFRITTSASTLLP